MGRYITTLKDPELLYIADSLDDLNKELPEIKKIVQWGNTSFSDSGYDIPEQTVEVVGLKVYLRYHGLKK